MRLPMESLSPEPHLGLAVHILVSIALGAGLLAAGRLLRHRAEGSRGAKHETYECGEKTIGSAWTAIPVGFYLVALLFILFDVEAAFLFLWVQGLEAAGKTAFVAMAVFLAVLLLGWVYAWKKGDLDWSR